MEWFFLECTKVKAHNLYSIYRSSMSKAAANVEADVPTVALHVLNKTVNHKRKSSCAVSFVLKLWTERWLALQHNSTAPCTMQQTLRFKLPGSNSSHEIQTHASFLHKACEVALNSKRLTSCRGMSSFCKSQLSAEPVSLLRTSKIQNQIAAARCSRGM